YSRYAISPLIALRFCAKHGQPLPVAMPVDEGLQIALGYPHDTSKAVGDELLSFGVDPAADCAVRDVHDLGDPVDAEELHRLQRLVRVLVGVDIMTIAAREIGVGENLRSGGEQLGPRRVGHLVAPGTAGIRPLRGLILLRRTPPPAAPLGLLRPF